MNLMPKTMTGKKILKKLVFGELIEMPNKLISTNNVSNDFNSILPESNVDYKVILARAKL